MENLTNTRILKCAGCDAKLDTLVDCGGCIEEGVIERAGWRWIKDRPHCAFYARQIEDQTYFQGGPAITDIYPELIGQVRRHYEASEGAPGRCVDQAIEMIRKANVRHEVTTLAILEAAGYSGQQPAMEIVRRVTRRQ
ncbi:MAG: hypothetical protein MOB07_31380 [Acidobacteria bacterium]|nr:hypothetical protein [Acidobacteriota bacterium]